MLNVFGGLKKNFKFQQDYCTDNVLFRLHYKITTLILFVGSILVSSQQYIGEHIRCLSDSKADVTRVMNTFCFFTSTFTVEKHLNSSYMREKAIPHPGVGPLGIESDEPVIHHAYYQWVPFVLFGQALLFCLPHLVWKAIEGGRIKKLVMGLKFAAYSLADHDVKLNSLTIPSKSKREDLLQDIRKIFIGRLYVNRNWSLGLIFAEWLNLINIILQIYFTNLFLGGRFLQLGSYIMENGLDSEVTILDIVFPKVTKCTFHKYGPSGTIQTMDVMCVMALNIVNEKIYTFLWFWYLFLLITSIIAVVWRFLTMILHSRSKIFNEIVFSNACPGKLNPWKVLNVSRLYNFTDWLFLYYLAKNMDGYVFKEMFVTLAHDLDEPLIDISKTE